MAFMPVSNGKPGPTDILAGARVNPDEIGREPETPVRTNRGPSCSRCCSTALRPIVIASLARRCGAAWKDKQSDKDLYMKYAVDWTAQSLLARIQEPIAGVETGPRTY